MGLDTNRRQALSAVGLLAVAALLWGGYATRWRWTGFHQHATLWDWLELLMLPVAIGIAPLWARHRRRLDPVTRTGLLVTVTAFVTLVVVGYAFDVRWTGFPGNRLWDWLELLVLPLVVATLPVWAELSPPPTRARLLLGASILLFVAVVVAGYSLHWHWTGFQGNTLYDWLHLLVAPLLLPLVVVPAAAGWLTARAGSARE
jgi:hypothetical protein